MTTTTAGESRATRRVSAIVPALELDTVSVAYRQHPVLSDVTLTVVPGEIVAVVGPSGSGKSSLLRCVAGFLAPTAGTVRIASTVVADERRSEPPEARGVGFVFQHYALWPHMSVRDNVAYPWKARRTAPADRARFAEELLVRVGLAGLGDRRPATLSGGQQQRVALARGLAGDPKLLLLDEPLSSVDAQRRDELQVLIGDLVRTRGLATLVTTHDQREATALADRIAVLGGGKIVQLGTPLELYEQPANGFVARFMGALNVTEVKVVGDAGPRVKVSAGGTHLQLRDPSGVRRGPALLVARPELIRLSETGAGDQEGEVVRSVLADGRSEVRVRVGAVELRVYEQGPPSRAPGEPVGVVLEGCRLLASDEEKELPATTGISPE